MQPRTWVLCRHLIHCRDDGRIAAHIRVGDISDMREVKIAMGYVEEEITYRMHAHSRERIPPLSKDVPELLDVRVLPAGPIKSSPYLSYGQA